MPRQNKPANFLACSVNADKTLTIQKAGFANAAAATRWCKKEAPNEFPEVCVGNVDWVICANKGRFNYNYSDGSKTASIDDLIRSDSLAESPLPPAAGGPTMHAEESMQPPTPPAAMESNEEVSVAPDAGMNIL